MSTTSPNSPWARRAVLAAAGAGALAAGVGWRVWRGGGAPTPSTDGSAPEPSMDAFWALELPTPSGAGLPLQALRGRPLLINFWATWCPPCVKEMPELDRFAREFSGRGWQVLGVAIDQAEPVRAFLQQTPVNFPIVLASAEGLSWTRFFGNDKGGLPFTVEVNANGQPARRQMGATTFDELAGWAQAT